MIIDQWVAGEQKYYKTLYATKLPIFITFRFWNVNRLVKLNKISHFHKRKTWSFCYYLFYLLKNSEWNIFPNQSILFSMIFVTRIVPKEIYAMSSKIRLIVMKVNVHSLRVTFSRFLDSFKARHVDIVLSSGFWTRS